MRGRTTHPTTFKEVIDQWPSLVDFAVDVETVCSVAEHWRESDFIPRTHWNRVVRAAGRRNLSDVTWNLLTEIEASCL